MTKKTIEQYYADNRDRFKTRQELANALGISKQALQHYWGKNVLHVDEQGDTVKVMGWNRLEV